MARHKVTNAAPNAGSNLQRSPPNSPRQIKSPSRGALISARLAASSRMIKANDTLSGILRARFLIQFAKVLKAPSATLHLCAELHSLYWTLAASRLIEDAQSQNENHPRTPRSASAPIQNWLGGYAFTTARP